MGMLRRQWSRPPACALSRAARDAAILGVTAAGLVARVIYALTDHMPSNLGDQAQYLALAADFGEWWGSADAIRTPGYPLFVSVVSSLGGDTAVRVTQGVVVTGACYLLALTAARAGGLAAGRATAALGAVYWPLLGLPALVLSDALAASLLVVAVFCLLELRWTRRTALVAATASAALASGVLVRPNLVIVAPVLGVVALLLVPRGRRAATAVALVVPALALFAPWVTRNIDELGAPAPLSKSDAGRASVGAVHLPIDRHGGRFGAYYRAAHFFSTDRQPGGPLTVYEATGRDPWTILAGNLRERPLGQAGASLFWMRELWLVAFDDHAQYGQPPIVAYELILAVHALLCILAAAGLLLAAGNPAVQLTWLVAVVMTLPFLVVFSEPRYAVPMAMVLTVPAGLATARLARHAAARASATGQAAR